MPDLEIHSSQTNQNNIGYENCVQNRDEQQFSKRESYNLFHKINWGINTIDFPTHRTRVLWKNITRNHLSKMKNTCSNLRFLPATPRQHKFFLPLPSSFFFPLFLLSSSFFFLASICPSRPLPFLYLF